MNQEIARLIAKYDQDLAAAVEWWESHTQEDRVNLLRLLCDRRVPIGNYRGLNDAALKILRDLAALALGRIIISSEEEIEL